MVCDLLANCSFACVVALIDQANVSKICMRVRCCITAVCLFAHSGFGCIAVVAHGGMFALFSGDSDMNLWESNVEHSSGLVCAWGAMAALLLSLVRFLQKGNGGHK